MGYILKIINLFILSSLVSLTACTQQKQHDADLPKPKIEASKADAEKAVSDAEVIIPATVENMEISSSSEFPEELIKMVQDAQSDCKKSLNIEAKDITQKVDLVGDDRVEYIVQPDQIYCADDSVFRGHGGDQLVIYASSDGKKINKLFDSAVFGFKVLETKPKATVQVEVGGGYCGQNMDEISRAEAISCKRNLVWDEASKQLKMGEIQLDKK